MRLVTYARKHPGRLASRLLIKMSEGVSKEGGAAKQKRAPAVATACYLGIFVPTHSARAHHRTMRELRCWCRALDLLARGENSQAADLAAQRVKAIERSIVDGNWSRAQHLELIDPEGATLLDKSEDLMLAKEAEREARVKAPNREQWHAEVKGKGKRQKGKEKGGWKGAGKVAE